MIDRLPFRVRKMETFGGIARESRIAASFLRRSAAEAFMQAEISKFQRFGSDAFSAWGGDHPGHGVQFWIEEDQRTMVVAEVPAAAQAALIGSN